MVFRIRRKSSRIAQTKLWFGREKLKLLALIEKRNGKPIAQIADNLGKTIGMLYQHLKELKAKRDMAKNFEITLTGNMALLWVV
jgi:molybdopterin converting factor small subunit